MGEQEALILFLLAVGAYLIAPVVTYMLVDVVDRIRARKDAEVLLDSSKRDELPTKDYNFSDL